MAIDLLEDCTFCRNLNPKQLSEFSCDNADLDDFFQNDSLKYSEQKLGETYFFKTDDDDVVCAFTVSNDVLNLANVGRSRKDKVSKPIPFPKRKMSFPAVKIGRLGVSNKFTGKGVGSQLMEFIKAWFFDKNKTGCRFITVDAYNSENPIKYYKRNGFEFLIPDEKKELDYLKNTDAKRFKDKEALDTRIMYFDLIQLKK